MCALMKLRSKLSSKPASTAQRTEASAGGDRRCLHLWFPPDYDLGQLILPYMEKAVPDYVWDWNEGRLQLPLPETQVMPVVVSLGDLLAPEEAQEIKALLLPEHATPEATDIGRVKLLATLINERRADWLRGLIAESRLTSHFQPIVHIENTARIMGYESLLRGIGDDGKLIPPIALLNCSRHAGMLQTLDEQARRTACREFSQQKMRHALFVNFSPVALVKSDVYLKSTLQLVDSLGLPREQIVFEIVEMDQIEDLPLFRQVLTRYRDAGFRIALDDAGAGYSSLNLLHQLRPEFLKIDMALVRNVHQDSFKGEITRNLIDLARHLNIHTIAEGVECEGEFKWLRENGVNYIQGYLIGKPVNPPVRYVPDLNKRTPEDLNLVQRVIRARMQQHMVPAELEA